MFKKIVFSILIAQFASKAVGQERNDPEPFYINVFISADKTIFVERDKTDFEEVKTTVSEIVRNMPFKLDQRIVYRIFADETLNLDYIMDVNQEMLSGYGENVQTLKYLLDTAEFNIDGQNWFKSIDMEKLKKVN